MSGSAAASDATNAANYFEAERLNDKADSHGRIGLVSTVAGGALVLGGIVWIVTREPTSERTTVTGWIAPGGGGIAAAGRF
jgi:hypothetical protein